ncbi:MAG: hypothetical protein QW331_03485, partial [Candidatus Woesearchaeota archaeon]
MKIKILITTLIILLLVPFSYAQEGKGVLTKCAQGSLNEIVSILTDMGFNSERQDDECGETNAKEEVGTKLAGSFLACIACAQAAAVAGGGMITDAIEQACAKKVQEIISKKAGEEKRDDARQNHRNAACNELNDCASNHYQTATASSISEAKARTDCNPEIMNQYEDIIKVKAEETQDPKFAGVVDPNIPQANAGLNKMKTGSGTPPYPEANSTIALANSVREFKGYDNTNNNSYHPNSQITTAVVSDIPQELSIIDEQRSAMAKTIAPPYTFQYNNCVGERVPFSLHSSARGCITPSKNVNSPFIGEYGVEYYFDSGTKVICSLPQGAECETYMSPEILKPIGPQHAEIITSSQPLFVTSSFYEFAENGHYFLNLAEKPIEKIIIIKNFISMSDISIENFLRPVKISFGDSTDVVLDNSINLDFTEYKKINGNGYSNIFLPATKTGQIEAAFPAGYRADYAVGRTIVINWLNTKTIDDYEIKDAKKNVYLIKDGKVIDSNGKILQSNFP